MATNNLPHALLVLAPQPGDHFWTDAGEAPAAALAQARRLRPALRGLQATVLLTDARLVTAFEAEGWAARTIAAPAGDDGWLPPGASAALRELPPSTPALVADLRCQGIGEPDARALRQTWERAPDATVLLTEPPHPHPCQLQRHFLTLGMGFAVLFDAWEQAHGVRVARSRPLRLPAPTLDAEVNQGQVWDLESLLKGAPLPQADPASALASGRALALFGPDGRATALFPAHALPPAEDGAELCGVSLGEIGLDRATVERRGETFFFRLARPGSHPLDRLTLHLVGANGALDLVYRTDTRCGLPWLPAGAGIPYGLLREVREGSYNYSTGIAQELNLWRQSGGTLVSGASGKVIHGRQAFPECVQLAPGMCMGRASDLVDSRMDRLRLLRSANGLGRVRTLVDHLRRGLATETAPAPRAQQTEESAHARV